MFKIDIHFFPVAQMNTNGRIKNVTAMLCSPHVITLRL